MEQHWTSIHNYMCNFHFLHHKHRPSNNLCRSSGLFANKTISSEYKSVHNVLPEIFIPTPKLLTQRYWIKSLIFTRNIVSERDLVGPLAESQPSKVRGIFFSANGFICLLSLGVLSGYGCTEILTK